jgi:hypothetical protein
MYACFELRQWKGDLDSEQSTKTLSWEPTLSTGPRPHATYMSTRHCSNFTTNERHRVARRSCRPRSLSAAPTRSPAAALDIAPRRFSSARQDRTPARRTSRRKFGAESASQAASISLTLCGPAAPRLTRFAYETSKSAAMAGGAPVISPINSQRGQATSHRCVTRPHRDALSHSADRPAPRASSARRFRLTGARRPFEDGRRARADVS